MSNLEPSWTRLSALIYTGFSTAAALLFLGATLVIGREYTLVARIGGTLWVFILSMIISMPIVIPAVRKQYSG